MYDHNHVLKLKIEEKTLLFTFMYLYEFILYNT